MTNEAAVKKTEKKGRKDLFEDKGLI